MARIRIRKLGLLTVLSQIGFVTLIRPYLERKARPRIAEICRTLDLERHAPASDHMHRVPSVNSDECRALIKRFNPKVIVVNGTRIIGKKTLDAAGAVILNTHLGVTPNYRGAHGGYWALHENDPDHCGVTIHLVDSGIDTGNVVSQAKIDPTPADNFSSYAYLQTGAALPILAQAIRDALQGKLQSRLPEGPSGLWYHPGLFRYLRARFRGVR
jgi:methionyl-tRNA formyltransferase